MVEPQILTTRAPVRSKQYKKIDSARKGGGGRTYSTVLATSTADAVSLFSPRDAQALATTIQ